MDTNGRQADFHALRMRFGSTLQKNNVPLVAAMKLMRHSDPRLTTKNYLDEGLLDPGGAVNRLNLSPHRQPQTNVFLTEYRGNNVSGCPVNLNAQHS